MSFGKVVTMAKSNFTSLMKNIEIIQEILSV